MHSKQITIRSVSEELARRLGELSKRRGESVNATVLFILQQALDVNERRTALLRYATWTQADREEFEEALKVQRTIDVALWE